jgi:uncharacterized protein (TIGR02996 family)
MTDDEAFIRAIVDNPGDDAPRLIYADWLDERGDPRGEYLRAEVEWAKDRSAQSMDLPRKTNASIDSVWLARVSRPPLGVCCDHIRLQSEHPPSTSIQIKRLEKRLGLSLPCEYRAFLLNYNGGSAFPNWFSMGDDEYGTLFTFFWIGPSTRAKEDHFNLAWEHGKAFWSKGKGKNLIPIGEGVPVYDWTNLCIRASGKGIGSVFVLVPYEDSEYPIRKVADSLPKLLAQFTDIRPDWDGTSRTCRQRNMSVDTHFYPLGSCTMKYNPSGTSGWRAAGHRRLHPYQPEATLQGMLQLLYELQKCWRRSPGCRPFRCSRPPGRTAS